MTRTRKLLLVLVGALVGILVLLLLAGALLLPRWLEVDRYRGRLEARAGESLGRSVTLGKLSLEVFPTPRLKAAGLRVDGTEEEGEAPVLRAEGLQVGVSLWALLGGDLRLDWVRLDQPSLRLVRRADGTLTLQDLLETQKPGEERDREEFPVVRLLLREGRVELVDHHVPSPQGPARLVLESLDLEVSGLDRDPPWDVDLEARLAAGRIAVLGSLDPGRGGGRAGFQGTVEAEALPLDGLSPWTRELMGRAPQGRADARLRIRTGEERAVELEGRISIREFRADPSRPAPGLDLALDLAGTAEEDLSSGRFQRFLVKTGRARLEGSLSWRPAEGGVRWDLDLEPSTLARSEAETLVRAAGGAVELPMLGAEPFDLQGRLTARSGSAVMPLSGRARLGGLTVRGEGGQDLTLDAALSWEGSLAEEGRTVDLARFTLESRETSLVAAGRARSSPQGTGLRARTLEPARMSANDLQALMALAGVSAPFRLETDRPLTFAGSMERPAGGEVTLDGELQVVQATLETDRLRQPVRVDRTEVRLRGTSAEVRVEGGAIGRSAFSGTFNVRQFDPPRVGFDLQSPRAELSELLSFLDAPAKEPGTGGGDPGTASAGDLVSGLAAEGSLKVAEGSFETLRFRDLETRIRVDGYTVRFEPLRLGLYGGDAQLRASFDLGGREPSYQLAGRLDGVDINALLTENTEFRDQVFGTAAARYDLAGSGAGLETVARGLKGSGNLSVRDGRVARLEFFEELREISGLFGERTLERLSRKLAQEGTTFSELGGNFRLSEGVLRTQDLLLASPEATVTSRGTVGVLSSRVDLEGDVVFSQELSRSMKEEGSLASKALWDGRRDRVVLPVEMRGPLAEMEVRPAGGSIAEQYARRRAEGKLKDVLGDVIGKGTESRDAGGTPGDSEGTDAEGAEPRVQVTGHRLSGNFLRPDLRFEGTFRGRDLARADLELRDGDGRTLWKQEDAFPEIQAWYRDHPRDEPAQIRFSHKLEAERLGGEKAWEVVVTLWDAAGRQATARFSESRGLKQLF